MGSDSKLSPRPPLWKVWLVASRPHTLTASLSPLVVAYNAAIGKIESIDYNDFVVLTFQWGAFCMLMQLGTNLHNDYADFVKGADTDKRVGQARATQKGWLTPRQTATASGCVLGLGFFMGLNFISKIHGEVHRTIWMTFIVVTSVFNAFAYTGGPWPLGYMGLGNFSIGYSGLGDVFVFLYFGLVATLTVPFLYIACTDSDQDLQTLLLSFAPYAVQVATLSTNIIVVNNLRDRHTDVDAGKRTLAVRFGAGFCRSEFITMTTIAYGLVIYDWLSSGLRMMRLLPLLSFPLARKEIYAIHTKDGSLLNPHVGGSAKVQFLFCILLGIALRMS